MANDEKRTLISPCGLYCGDCRRYRARTDKTLLKKIAEKYDIPVEEVFVCAGCRPMRGRVKIAGGEPVCDTYACATDNKKVEFCYQCEDFPCLKLAPCADRAQETPHNTKVYNLLCLQKLGVNAWLENYPRLLKQYQQGKKPKTGSDVQL